LNFWEWKAEQWRESLDWDGKQGSPLAVNFLRADFFSYKVGIWHSAYKIIMKIKLYNTYKITFFRMEGG
jgi:hypothetical protein